MEEIKQYINLQMRKMLEIFEKIIKFDIFFQEKEFKKSKSIFIYIVFIFLSVGSYISIFPERLVINTIGEEGMVSGLVKLRPSENSI